MTYEKSYFEDEVRDGFFVPSIMKQCFANAMQNYQDLRQFCEKREIPFGATYGTLMGAVRHGGFVPWDDDMDTAIFRQDFDRLYQASQESEEFEKWTLHDFLHENNKPEIVRSFSNYECTEEYRARTGGFIFRNMIDIFILDGIPSDRKLHAEYMKLLEYFEILLNYNSKYDDNKRWSCLQRIEKLRGFRFSPNSKYSLEYQIRKEWEGVLTEYSKMPADEWAMVWAWYLNRAKNQIYEKRMYEDYIEVPFEQWTVKIPIGYDNILRKIYGNYMQPVISNGAHNYPFFSKQEQKLMERNAHNSLRFIYEKEWMEKIKQGIQKKELFQEKLFAMVDILSDAHKFIAENFAKHELAQTFMDMLAECQELVVGFGEQAESVVVNPEKIVSVMEQYCECVYALYQRIVVENADEEVSSLLLQLPYYEEELRKHIKEIEQKKEVVFLTYHSKYWKAYHSLWEELSQQEDVRVVVLPVPYCYKNYNGEPELEHIQYEVDGYPEEVMLSSFKDYDFESRHPDVLYYQFPYDEYSLALMMLPTFYITNLRKYTDKLVFIPPFLTFEISDEDERSRYTLKWLLGTPGAVLADEIMVQSEQVAKAFRDVLYEVTGDDEEFDWEKQVISEDFPLKKWEERKRILFQGECSGDCLTADGIVTECSAYDEVVLVPEEWLETRFHSAQGCKKILLYYVSGSVLYEYKEKAIEKVNQVLSMTQEKCGDIVLLWHLDLYAEKILKEREPAVWKDYQELIRKFQESGDGILDASGDYKRAAAFCDGFYGDGSILMHECQTLKKPTIWENPQMTVIEEFDDMVRKIFGEE